MDRFAFVSLALLATACGDGAAALVPGVETFELSAAAAPARRPLEQSCGATVDIGDDGVVDQRWTFSYSDEGRSEVDLLKDEQGAVVEIDAFTMDRARNLLYLDVTFDGGRFM